MEARARRANRGARRGVVHAGGRGVTCPENEVLMRFVAQEAPHEERVRVVRHLLGCADCRDLAALLARMLSHAKAARTASNS